MKGTGESKIIENQKDIGVSMRVKGNNPGMLEPPVFHSELEDQRGVKCE